MTLDKIFLEILKRLKPQNEKTKINLRKNNAKMTKKYGQN